jgi:hypothetical protein
MGRERQKEMTKVVVAFRNFANAPKNLWASLNFKRNPMTFNNADLC